MTEVTAVQYTLSMKENNHEQIISEENDGRTHGNKLQRHELKRYPLISWTQRE